MTCPPRPRAGHALAYDSARQRAILFGGNTDTSPLVIFGDTWWLGPLFTAASATPFGSSCANSTFSFTPDPSGRPVIGNAGSAFLTNVPTTLAAVALGWSNQFFGPFPLPVTLAGIGMPGCDLLQSADVLGLATQPISPTHSQFSLAIPNSPTLVGLHVYLQAFAFAPSANPLEILVTNAIDWKLGDV